MGRLTLTLVGTLSLLCACASQAQLVDALQPGALKVAQQRGSTELECPAATGAVLSQETLEEPQGTGWYTPPHRAEYAVLVSGCGKRATYAVECDDRKPACAFASAEETPRPHAELADQLRPDALLAAQQRGATDFGCPAATAEVQTQQTLEEPQGTGWYTPPRRAVYEVQVSGCGMHRGYLVACDTSQKGKCVAGGLHSEKPASSLRTLADELQPRAVKVAQQRGSSELACPETSTEVLRQETLQEPQGTGWYTPPFRAVYTVQVSGCGQRASYFVACEDRKKACVANSFQRAPSE